MSRHAIATLACAMTTIVGATTNLDAQSSRPSAVACDRYARNYAEDASRQGQVIGGGAKGSLLGAGVGAIFGAAGAGAAIGATIGLIGGGAKRNATASRLYDVAYQDCMSGRVGR